MQAGGSWESILCESDRMGRCGPSIGVRRGSASRSLRGAEVGPHRPAEQSGVAHL